MNDATNWHDTYQEHANTVDAFFAELLEMLPGATDTGSDAYDQIPRAIEALLAEVKELRARIDSADQAFIDMAQANGGVALAPERLPQISRIMSALRGHETPHRVAYNRVWAEVERIKAERDKLRGYLDEVGRTHNGCPNTRDDVLCPWCRIAELETDEAEVSR